MTHQGRIIIADYCSHILSEGLTLLGFHVVYDPEIPMQDLDDIIDKFQGIVVNTRTVMDKTRIDKATQLEFIARLGSGLDNIDLEYCHQQGIDVISSPEGNRQAVAEHALGMILALLNKFKTAHFQIRDHEWNREAVRGRELSAMKIGVIGCGNNGSAFVNVLAGFGGDIFIYDKYKEMTDSTICKSNIYICTLEKVQEISDLISFHIPLNDETAFLIDESFVKKCKHGVIIVNTSRGKIADPEALKTGLISGQIGGLCLDVFTNEKPLTFSKEEKALMDFFVSNPAVILTPHVAGWTIESKEKIAEVLLEKIKAKM